MKKNEKKETKKKVFKEVFASQCNPGEITEIVDVNDFVFHNDTDKEVVLEFELISDGPISFVQENPETGAATGVIIYPGMDPVFYTDMEEFKRAAEETKNYVVA